MLLFQKKSHGHFWNIHTTCYTVLFRFWTSSSIPIKVALQKPGVEKRKFVFPYDPSPYNFILLFISIIYNTNLGLPMWRLPKAEEPFVSREDSSWPLFPWVEPSCIPPFLFSWWRCVKKRIRKKHTHYYYFITNIFLFTMDFVFFVFLLFMYLVSNHVNLWLKKYIYPPLSKFLHVVLFVCVDIFYPCVYFWRRKKTH